ncbi:MAG TPA: hypothetical protein VG826_04095 [Pirellulales bacterium]|nr:hypothetical protein [Pirellulales bacterium]
MAKVRRSLRLFDYEREQLVDLYRRYRIPIDQFESRADELERFTGEWNESSGRKDAPGEVLHYMRTQRKRGLWVRLDGNHQLSPPVVVLSLEEGDILVKIYTENVALLASGSDNIAYSDEVASMIAREFAAATGRIVPAYQLVAKLTAFRKRGLLPKIDRTIVEQGSEDIGFDDIDQASGA